MSKLYLTDNERYRIRMFDASVVVAYWDDHTMRFIVKTTRTTKPLLMDAVAAVAPFHSDRRYAHCWTPLDQCFRAKHKHEPRTWVHPYAARIGAKAGV